MQLPLELLTTSKPDDASRVRVLPRLPGFSPMSNSLRICVADDEPDMREYFTRILPRLGHQVVSVARNGRELVEHCLLHQPDLVITDIKMPEMDGITAAERIYQSFAVPVILVSAYHDAELVARAELDHVLAYLVKPIKQADLEPAIAIVRRRFTQLRKLLLDNQDLRQALDAQRWIERACDRLARDEGLSIDQALQRLERLAQAANLRLAQMARRVVENAPHHTAMEAKFTGPSQHDPRRNPHHHPGDTTHRPGGE